MQLKMLEIVALIVAVTAATKSRGLQSKGSEYMAKCKASTVMCVSVKGEGARAKSV